MVKVLTMYQLEKYADKFLLDNYDMKLTVPLKLNGRLKVCCGRFNYSRSKAVSVEINKYFFENNEPVVVLDVLRHELVHYALYMKGEPHSDGHPTFENELKRLGVVSQKTINKYSIKSKPSNHIVYACVKCDTEYTRKRALPNEGKGYRCGIKTCRGDIKIKGRKMVS